ncbi:MAG: restriction endonuclease [Bifidobacteriaceae bacterium]|jgi:restriction system protein|nr:restriction endonuclease [Bifidobacteriaceae bacterium]
MTGNKIIAFLRMPLILLAIVVVIVILVLALIFWIRQVSLRSEMQEKYGAKVPSAFHVKKIRQRVLTGFFFLKFPVWLYAKKDGTQDLRHKGNSIVFGKSEIHIDDYILTCKDVILTYYLVLDIRGAGTSIGYNELEKRKRQDLSQKLYRRQTATSVLNIVDNFSSHPTDFEPFCADLFRNFGFSAEVTPPTRDGGFDIRLCKDGVKYIAECKCYDVRHHVGRTILQKLKGANAVEQAQGMFVITTSKFTRDAIAFAEQSGIQLIDGDRLVHMCHQVWGSNLPASIFPEAAVTLTKQELLSKIPEDMRMRFI